MALWLLAAASASAEVRWEKTALTFHPSAAETSVVAEFTYTNVGPEPAVLESVQTCCACLTAQPTRKTCPPGEQGTIKVLFDLGQRTGVQLKPISVQFSGELKPVSLTLEVHIPEILKIDSPLVFWDANEEATAKSFALELIPGAVPVRIEKVVSPDPGFTARLQTVKPDRVYQLAITPAQTAHPSMAVVSIECLAGDKTRKIFQVYAQVRSAVPVNPPSPPR